MAIQLDHIIVASRDTSPYAGGGLRVVDPWQS